MGQVSRSIVRSSVLIAIFFAFLPMAQPAMSVDPPGEDQSRKQDTKPRKKSSKKPAKKADASSISKPKQDLAADFPKGKREKEFAKLLGDGYKIRHTPHFVVLYNADEKIVKDFMARIEKTFDAVLRFASTLDIKVAYKADKLPIIFCKDHDDFRVVYRIVRGGGDPPSEAAGLYFSGKPNVSLFYDMSRNKYMLEWAQKVKQLQEEARRATDANTRKAKIREAQWYSNRSLVYQEEQNRSVVQHEVAHQLLYNFRVHNWDAGWANPQWLVEGMATLFETPPGKRGAGFNVINQQRLGEIREKMPAISAAHWRSFIGQPSPGRQMLSTEGYAQSWALVYYLAKRKPKELPTYVELIKKRKVDDAVPPDEELADFEKCFGKVDDKFARSIADFIKKLPYRPD